MTEQLNNKPIPFTLRLTAQERIFLEECAGSMPLGTYIRSIVLNEPAPRQKQRRRTKRPTKDKQALAQALGLLGAKRIPNNLNQIARALNNGTLIVTEETEEILRDACKHIECIRNTIIKALGYFVEEDHG